VFSLNEIPAKFYREKNRACRLASSLKCGTVFKLRPLCLRYRFE